MLNKKSLEAIQESLKEKFLTSQLFQFQTIHTTEINLVESFNLKDHWVVSFFIQTLSIPDFKNIPLECELLRSDSRDLYKHTFRNLLTNELVREDHRALGKEKLLPDNQYRFWVIPIEIEIDDEFEDAKIYQVLIPPVDLEALEEHIKGSK